MTATVIDFAARARARKVRYLIASLATFARTQGPDSPRALLELARSLTIDAWALLDSIAQKNAKRDGRPYSVPSSDLTRQLMLDELEDRARMVRVTALEAEAKP